MEKEIMANAQSLPMEFQWGPFQTTDKDSESHYLGLGTTGSGKTLLLRLLQQSVLPLVGQGRGYHALVYDAKQDQLPIIAGYCDPSHIKLFNAYDARSVAWDIAKDVTRSPVAMETAFTLFPDVSDNSPFFRNAARHCSWGIMCSFTLSKLDWSFADLLRGLNDPDLCARILERHSQTKGLVRKYLSDKKLTNDIFATIASITMLYEPIAASWEHATEWLSISDCINNEYIVVLGNSETSRQTIDRVNSVLFKRWTDLTLEQPDGTHQRFWTFIDELSEAGNLAGLPSFLKKARSKGGRMVVACQSIEGLKTDKMYGEKVTADLLSCFGNRMFARLECPETAEYCSKYIGDQEIIQTSETESGNYKDQQKSTSYSNVVQRTVLPSEFMNIESCCSENGLTAMFKMRSSPACWDNIPGELLFNDWLIPKNSDIPHFVPIDSMAEFLEPWTPFQETVYASLVVSRPQERPPRDQEIDRKRDGQDIPDLDF